MALDEKFRSILTNCPHYYDIINFSFEKDDEVIKIMIKEYTNNVFNIANNSGGTTNRLRIIDLVVNELIKKEDFYYFAKERVMSAKAMNEDVYIIDPLEFLIVLYKNFTFKKEYIKKEAEPVWL